jgi:hypothetical protein
MGVVGMSLCKTRVEVPDGAYSPNFGLREQVLPLLVQLFLHLRPRPTDW